MSNIIIHVLMGLPGSGKTHFANKFEEENDNVITIHLDKFISNDKYDFDKLLPHQYRYLDNHSLPYEQHIILDGLFLTNIRVGEVLNMMLDDIYGKLRMENCKVVVHHWNKDIETCLHNDKYRRLGTDSRAVIKNALYENVNIDVIKQVLGEDYADISIGIEDITVKKYPLFERLKNEYGDCLKSGYWSIGGRWGNCWGDSGRVSPETPLEFDEFDQLLENVAPSISFLQYKKLRNNCVTLVESTDYGYYGSYTDENHWECDIPKLFGMLIDMKFITEE